MTSFRLDRAGTAGIAALIVLAGGCGSASDPRPASWSYISAAIVEPNCATVSCHSRAAAVSGLDLSTAARGFTSLTGLWIWIVDPTGTAANGCMPVAGTIVCQRQHRSLVVPFDPAQSRVVHMLRAQGAPRMPPDRPLAEADIRLIEKWILNGATESDGPSGPTPGDAGIDSDAGGDGLEAGAPDAPSADGAPSDVAGSGG